MKNLRPREKRRGRAPSKSANVDDFLVVLISTPIFTTFAVAHQARSACESGTGTNKT